MFTDPVSIPCGHNFCQMCVTQYWDINVQCQCPNCKKLFLVRPELQVNTFISEMVAQFRHKAQHKTSSSEQPAAKPGEVPCDVCTGTTLKALKTCLVCLTSYCETHLEPHLTTPSLKKHQLIDPVENLEDRMCKKHNKQLELFFKTDQMCVCVLCIMFDHKTHEFVPLEEEHEGKKVELGKTDSEIQQMIQKRRLKRSVEISNTDADREMAEGVQVFSALKESVERGQAELMETIKEKQRRTETQAEGFIKELEQEISELRKRSSEVEQLSRAEDQLHLLQSFSPISTPTFAKDFPPASYEGTVVRAVAQLENTLSKEMTNYFQAELRRVQNYAVNVTFDLVQPKPNQCQSQHAANDANKCRCVLSKKGLSSGRFYFEVVTSSTCTLGVARTSTNRKITLRPTNGYWTICVKWKLSGHYTCFAAADEPVGLSLKSKPRKVGVFVDHDQGLVSFHDVDTAALIYCFAGYSFAGTVYPFLSPCNHNGGKLHSKDEACVLQ